ncbi:hypothetical protein EV1_031209 [Malus domestica]
MGVHAGAFNHKVRKNAGRRWRRWWPRSSKLSEGKGLGGKGLEGTRDLRFTKAEVRKIQVVASNLCKFKKRKWKRKIKMKKKEEGKKRDGRAEKISGTTTTPLWQWVQDLDAKDEMSLMAKMVAVK